MRGEINTYQSLVKFHNFFRGNLNDTSFINIFLSFQNELENGNNDSRFSR